MAAFWSPFFVAMAVALTHARVCNWAAYCLLAYLALLAMGLTAWQVERLGVETLKVIRCGSRPWGYR